jgi:hypothetical protein
VRQRVAAWLMLAGCLAATGLIAQEVTDLPYVRRPTWPETLLASRAALRALPWRGQQRRTAPTRLWAAITQDFPIQADWVLQDGGPDFPLWFESAGETDWERRVIARVLGQLGETGGALQKEYDELCRQGAAFDDPRWLQLYARACEQRRGGRLRTVLARAPRIVFTKHPTIRPSFFAYTEGQSDAQNERHFIPGSTLCVLEMEGLYGKIRDLLNDPTGAIRDPAVSFDGQRVLFAWKKSLNGDDYHLYEMEAGSGRVRQITFGLGFADYEPAYLPNGDLIFASTRCVQTVDCWWTEVSNLYTCDGSGRFLRRLGFDQVHTVFPTVTDDGRVIYTRWDYNDRGQIFVQPLFQMNPDGTGQTEFYGNNSWFPTTIAHARNIPGTQKVLAILCGHHSSQAGKLAVIDPAQGRQENQGVQLVAPVRSTRAERIDGYGQAGELFQYPFPLNETEFLVTYAPFGWEDRLRRGDAAFGIYWMNQDGQRELLASDPRIACQQPVPLAPRPRPTARPSTVDYRKRTGTYYIQNVHAGPGLTGVSRGAVRKLRVVALDFRPAGVGNNGSSGPGGGALISTPISIGNGAWDIKTVLGEARVYEDGSAFFTVPARTPVYFQALDDNGHAVQTMRSWTTLQPGENQACVGCHEHKNTAPSAETYEPSQALRHGAQELEPFYGPPRGFSFQKEIQPILDRHCVACHKDRSRRMETGALLSLQLRERDPVRTAADNRTLTGANGSTIPGAGGEPTGGRTNAFSLLASTTWDRLAARHWSDSYLNLTLARPANNDWDRGSFGGVCDGKIVNWIGSQSIPAALPPYMAGACRSGLIPLLENGHFQVNLTREEMDKIACWIDLFVPYCGDYTEANAWQQADLQKYERYLLKRKGMEEIERRNLQELLGNQ